MGCGSRCLGAVAAVLVVSEFEFPVEALAVGLLDVRELVAVVRYALEQAAVFGKWSFET